MLGQIVEDRYRIEEELGAGAMGRVYRARHVRVGNQVAIKVIHAELLAQPKLVERFEREAQIAARLAHPNVAGVLDVGALADGRQLMVLELARGRRLTELLRAPLPRAQVIDLVRQILHGLAHAHRAGLVHRDLKPDNILVEDKPDGSQVARIVDFGIAVLRDSGNEARLTELNTVVGTPHYMSPEHATGRAVDARTDLFALGVIVHEMLAGAQPFAGTGAEVALANVTRDPPAIPGADPLLDAFGKKLMARQRERRFQSATEALAMLELVERDRIAAARTLSAPRLAAGTQPPPLPADSDSLPTVSVPTTQVRRTLDARHVAKLALVAALFVALFLLGYAIV